MQPEEYRKMAAVEDAMWYYRALHRHVLGCLTAVISSQDANVLDAGCGTGGLMKKIHAVRPEWNLIGLDFSELACDFTRQRTGLVAIQGSVEKMPFADRSFDGIYSCDVVCQVNSPATALAEFWRGLKPGGVLVMTMPAYQWMYSYHDREVGNLRRYRFGELAALLQEAEFLQVNGTYWNMLPFPLAVLRRKVFPRPEARSDVALFPAPVEAMFNAMMRVEDQLIGEGWKLPFGSSLLTVARKPLI